MPNPKAMGTYTGSNDLVILVNGKKETIKEELAVELNNGVAKEGDFVTYYNSAALPIILRMRNGFYIGLREIK